MSLNCAFKCFFLPVHGTGWLEWVEVGYFSSPTWKLDPAGFGYFLFLSQLGSVIPQQVRFWLTSFPWGQTLLRRIECSQVFKNVSFSPFAEMYLLWKPVEVLEANLTILWEMPRDRVPLKVLTIRLVHTDSPATHQLQFKFFPALVFTAVQQFLPLSLQQ